MRLNCGVAPNKRAADGISQSASGEFNYDRVRISIHNVDKWKRCNGRKPGILEVDT